MSAISSKTFSGSFSRYWNENLNFKKKKHFFHFLKLRYVPQCVTPYNFEMEKYFKLAGGKGYIEKSSSQSVLKHSVDHFKGIGMKI